jgi:hypothetical protein
MKMKQKEFHALKQVNQMEFPAISVELRTVLDLFSSA